MPRAWCSWGLVLAMFGSPTALFGVAPGDPAPEFSLLDVGGQPYGLSDYSGQVVLLALVGYG